MPTDLVPLEGRADLVAEDASNLRADATRLGVMQEQLAALRIDGSGHAVEGLQARITEAAGLVQEVFEHYVGTYRALEDYGPELAGAQQQFDEARVRRADALALVRTSEERRRSCETNAEHLRASGVPQFAIGEVEQQAFLALLARNRAQEAVAQAEADLDAARRRYDDAAQAALAQVRMFDTVCIDTGAYLDAMIDDVDQADLVRSVVSSTGTPEQREQDGWFDPQTLAAQSLVFAGTGLGAGATWVHQNTIVKSNGVTQWRPYNTLGTQSTGVFTQTQTRSLRSIYGQTGGQAHARVRLGPRAATVVSRSAGLFGAAWTFYDVAASADVKYWYLAPEDRQAWATMEASAVTAGSVTLGAAGATAGTLCGPLVVACAPAFGAVGGLAGGEIARSAFASDTSQDRTALAVGHFMSEHPGTSVHGGKIYYEGRPIGYFSIG